MGKDKQFRQINQSSISLRPNISLPPIPENLDKNQIEQFLEAWLYQKLPSLLPSATKEAMETFLKTQPSGQIEYKITDKLWKKR